MAVSTVEFFHLCIEDFEGIQWLDGYITAAMYKKTPVDFQIQMGPQSRRGRVWRFWKNGLGIQGGTQ